MFKNNPRTRLLLLGAIIFFAFALRMVRVNSLLMWGDEGFSVFSSSRDLLTITFDTTTIDPHPPLYYYLLHFFQIAGRSELAIRFFSVFFGTATIPLAWVIGKRMFDARVGMLAAFLTAIAPFAVHYSQEVRMYALAMFWVALGLYFFVRLYSQSVSASSGEVNQSPSNAQITSDKNRLPNDTRDWLGYATAMFLALYTLYHTAFIFLAIGLVLLPLFKTHRVFVLRWFAVSFGIVATFLPWLAFRYTSAFTGIRDVAGETIPMDFFTYAVRGFAAISVGTTIPLSIAFQLAELFALLIVLALIVAFATRTAKSYDVLLLSLTLVPIVAYYPLYLALPLYRGRLFALACIPFVLLFARSTAIIAQRARLAFIPIVLFFIGVSAYSLNNYFVNYNRYSPVVEDYLPLIRDLEPRAQPGDTILFHAYWHQGYFLTYYRGAPLEYRALDNQVDLQTATSQARNVWAIVQGLPHHGAEDWLAQNAFSLGEEKFGQMRLLSYRAGTPARGEMFATPIQLDNGIYLLGYHLNDTPIESGRGIVTVQLDWQAKQPIVRDYTVSIRITNPRGDIIWTQSDSQPANGTFPTSKWQTTQVVHDYHTITIPAGTPPGEYTVQLLMYDSVENNPANITAPENRRGQTIRLGNISIARAANQTNTLAPPNPINARWKEIALIGLAGLPDTLRAGDTLPLTLYWRTIQKPAHDYRAQIQIVDSAGTVHTKTFRPGNENFPTRLWNAGETWLDKHHLTIAADTQPGIARILVSLVDAQNNPVVPAIEIARVNIVARKHHFDLPSPQFKTQATLGGKIKLLGYDLQNAKPLGLTLYWQAIDRITERYKVFVHLVDAQGNLVAQRDSEPQHGDAPTTSWLNGEVIADTYQIDLPENSPGEYTLFVGMYQAAGGNRLVIDETKADTLPLTKSNRAP